MSADQAPVPSALRRSAVTTISFERDCGWKVSIVAETGEAREVSHLAL